MLASSSKDKPLTSAEACALYYFPEISSGADKTGEDKPCPAKFVSGTFDCKDNGAPAAAELQDSAAVQALMEAFNKGLEQGRAEALAAQKEKVDHAAAALEAAVKALTDIRQGDIACMEKETVKLALAIAEKIIGHHAEHERAIAHVVKAAMEKVSDPRQLTLRLNPKDIETINDAKGELLPAEDFGAVLRIEADATIKQGGCIIETQLGDVDARIDRQIQSIAALLTAQLPKPARQG